VLAAATIALTVAIAARNLHCSAYDASNLRVSPDEIEYAVCARRLATLGTYDMDFDGVSTPPHSTPWFSAVLAPTYVVASQGVGNGIWVVFAFAVVGVIIARSIGTTVAGPLAGALASIALVSMPLYVRTAHSIMTDGPSVVLGLASVWLFMRWSKHEPRLSESVIAGLLVTVATAFRSVYLSLLLPFAWRAVRAENRRIAHLAALLAPLAALAAADGFYNRAAFGDWERTGYQFWSAVPYDYPDLVLSPSYLPSNLASLAAPGNLWPLALGMAGIVLLVWRRPPYWSTLLGAFAATSLPIVAVHLVYFYHAPRFFEYFLVLCAVLGGIGVACAIPAGLRQHRTALISSVAVLVIAFVCVQPPSARNTRRREAVDAVLSRTRDDAVIISGLEPVYLAAFDPPDSSRTYLAASRDVEFASKVLVETRVSRELAAPRDAFDHAAAGLLEHGGRWAIAHTADEMHDQIDAWVRSGRPVCLETGFLKSPIATERMLGGSLRLQRFDPYLMQVLPAE
jgi:hypothetical protein